MKLFHKEIMIRKGLSHLIHAFRFSMEGLWAMRKETAFLLELLVGIVAVPLAWLLPGLDLVWRVLLTLAWLALPTVEAVNTSIEALVDMVSPEWHPLAKKAKDCGSAAVMCAGIGNIVVWLSVLFKYYI